MKKIITIIFICTTLMVIAETVRAQESGFGVGAVINTPTPPGISYKAWIDDRVAIAGAASFSIGDGVDFFYTHADVQIHSNNLFSEDNPMPTSLKFYYGGGVGLQFLSDNVDDQVDLRSVFGTTYMFKDAPVDFFFELSPTIRIQSNTRFFFTGGLGFRYFLN